MFYKQVRLREDPIGFMSWLDHDQWNIDYFYKQWISPVLKGSRIFAYKVNPKREEEFVKAMISQTGPHTILFKVKIRDLKFFKTRMTLSAYNYPEYWRRYANMLDKPVYFDEHYFCDTVGVKKLMLDELVYCRPESKALVERAMNVSSRSD